MTTPPCRACNKTDDVICYPDDHALTVCPACCAKTQEHTDGESGHQFYYERGEGHMCRYCGIPRDCTDYEHEPSEYDVPISFIEPRAPGEKLGTPISELSSKPGTDGYEKFKRIAKSWGYD